MKKITFKFRNIQTGQLDSLDGYEIKLSGLTLGAHKEYGWTLYELRSGFIFLSSKKPGESLKSCTQRAKERLEKYGIVEINHRIDAAIKPFVNNGCANRVED